MKWGYLWLIHPGAVNLLPSLAARSDCTDELTAAAPYGVTQEHPWVIPALVLCLHLEPPMFVPCHSGDRQVTTDPRLVTSRRVLT